MRESHDGMEERAFARAEKDRADALAFARSIAEKNGWRLNPDSQAVAWIADGLARNYNRYGYFQCPCRDSWGDAEHDSDIICPCEYCTADQADYGHCYCGLYLTSSFFAAGEPVRSIPERRAQELFP